MAWNPITFVLDQWRAIDAETERAPDQAGRFDARLAVILVIGALSLVAQEYLGTAKVYEYVFPASGGPYWELGAFAWWAGWRVLGYLVIPIVAIACMPGATFAGFHLSPVGFFRHLWIYAAMYVAVLPLVLVASQTAGFQETYPFYPEANRSAFDLWAWEAMYAAQFLALEVFFRGFLLAGLRRALGANAIFVVMVPYCMLHFGKPPRRDARRDRHGPRARHARAAHAIDLGRRRHPHRRRGDDGPHGAASQMMEIDYEATARLAFDVPLDADAHAALRVWADILEAKGDARGPLIALEHLAIDDAMVTDRHEHNRLVLDASAELLPTFAAALRVPRAVALDWRAGALYAAELDTRRAETVLNATAESIVTSLLVAPAAHAMRRIFVRVRKDNQVARVASAIAQSEAANSLEQVSVLTGPFARSAVQYSTAAAQLIRACPSLWMLAAGFSLTALTMEGAGEIRRADPAKPSGRRTLGRALFHQQHRPAALERIESLGAHALGFVEALMALLAPRVTDEPTHIAACQCLAAIGPRHAARAVPLLRKITGRTELYEVEARRAAGQALVALV